MSKTTKQFNCPLAKGNFCAPMARSCGSVNIITCRYLYRAYCLGYKEATAKINAKTKEKQEETPAFLNKKLHIQDT